MGGIAWEKEWCGGAAEVKVNKINKQVALTSECTPSQLATDGTTILDLVCTSNVLTVNSPCTNVQSAHTPLVVNMHTGNKTQVPHISELVLTSLPCRSQKIVHTDRLSSQLIIIGWTIMQHGL
jgi:hypothetical protein